MIGSPSGSLRVHQHTPHDGFDEAERDVSSFNSAVVTSSVLSRDLLRCLASWDFTQSHEDAPSAFRHGRDVRDVVVSITTYARARFVSEVRL